MIDDTPVDCPALHELKPNYPVRFAKRVPKTILMLETVVPDLLWLLGEEDRNMRAFRNHIYKAWTNSYGAVSAVFDDGKKLGVKPHEFIVDSWHQPTERF